MPDRTIAPALVIVAAVLAAPLVGQGPEGALGRPGGLHLADVLEAAEARNPMLQAIRSEAAATVAREPEASTLPDPTLQFGIMNFGVPGFETDMPTSMAPGIEVMQMLPFPGKLGLMGQIAGYSSRMADAASHEAHWEVRREVSGLFYDLYALDRQLEVMRRTLALLSDFQGVAQAMYASGTGRQADVLRATVEVARMDAEIRHMEAMRAGQAAELNAMLGRSAATEVASPELGELPLEVPGRETLLTWARESRPALARGRLAVERAGTQVALARREIWPDLTLGLAYGQRSAAMGTERMGSAMIGVSLPVHARSRQYAMRAEASAMEEMTRADLAAAEASVDANVSMQLAELERAGRLAMMYRTEVIPEARAMVESAFSSYRVGNVDFMTLVDGQMAVNRYEGELYQLLGDYGQAVAALESAVGRELPRTGPMLREQP